MDLALHFPLIKQRFWRSNHLHVRDCRYSSLKLLEKPPSFSYSSMGRYKKGSVCCKKPSDRATSNQEEIISLLKRIQTSISKGKSRGVAEEKSTDEFSENKPLTRAILDVLEKSRNKTEGGDTSVKEEQPKRRAELIRPPSSFTKRTAIPSAVGQKQRGKLPVTKSDKALEEWTEKEERPPLIETMNLAELKEVAKSRGIKRYSKLKKSDLLELLKISLGLVLSRQFNIHLFTNL